MSTSTRLAHTELGTARTVLVADDLPKPPPTLLVTSFMDRSVDVLATRLGAVRVLHTPVEIDDVIAAVIAAATLRIAPR